MEPSIYQQILKDSFSHLPPVLQFVHGNTQEIKAAGKVTVAYGKNRIARWLAGNRFPKEGVDMPISLHITRTFTEERWVRNFNGYILNTFQYLENGMLMEKVGNYSLVMDVNVKDGGLYFRQRITRFHRLRIPKIFNVFTQAEVHAESDVRWLFKVEVRTSLFGRIILYSGFMELKK